MATGTARSRTTLFGHPLHPMLVPIPLGALPTALVFDFLYVFTGTPAWFLAAFVATLIGIVGILIAALPGVVDLYSVIPRDGRAWRRGRQHMALGSTLALVFILIAAGRWFLLPAPGASMAWIVLVANVVGNIGLVVQGYLGAELLERHHIGVYPQEAEVDRQDPRGTRARGRVE